MPELLRFLRPGLPLLFCASLLSILVGTPAFAQEEAEPDSLRPGSWEVGLAGRLSGSQAGYRNWAEGGINTLATTGTLTGSAKRRTNGWEQAHDLRLSFGLVRQDTLRLRKSDDLISIQSAVKYVGNGVFRILNPTVAAGLRTQFAVGFNYDKNPFQDERPLPVKVSDFFAPATLTQSIGLTYKPSEWFTQRFGFAGKETVVGIERLAPLYGLTPGQRIRLEIGLESRSQFEREVFENVVVKSTLGLFAAFQKEDLPDLIWENLVVMRVNRWLNVGFELVSLYDRDIDEEIQVKEILSLGVTLVIL